MANTAHEQRSPEEHAFWDRRFDVVDGPVPGEPLPEHDPLDAPGPGPSPTPGARTVPRPLAPEPDTPWARALEWVRDRRGDPRLGVVALVVIAVVAGFVWYRIGLAGGSDAPPAAARTRSSAASTPATAPGGGQPADTSVTASGSPAGSDARTTTVVVHVAGAVARPGVVELPKAARVIDALEAVGGATPEADVDRLNLAAPVVDGARVYVPRHGEADPGTVGGGGATIGAAGGDGAPAAKINLNTATQEQLESLPGIGPTYAQAIIAERTRRNGFRSVNELREVRGIGEKRFAELAPLVTV